MESSLFEFAVAATLLILSPGPDTLLVTRNSLRGGSHAGLSTAAGTVTGLLGWALAAGLGLSSILAASHLGYDVLRFAGAAYLIWLGVTTLRRRIDPALGEAEALDLTNLPIQPPLRATRAYANGVISNLCNPKIGAFFVAFLPGFIPAGSSVSEASFLFGLWFAIETGVWLAILVWIIGRGTSWFTNSKIQRRLERVTGLVLIGFGIRLATEAR